MINELQITIFFNLSRFSAQGGSAFKESRDNEAKLSATASYVGIDRGDGGRDFIFALALDFPDLMA